MIRMKAHYKQHKPGDIVTLDDPVLADWLVSRNYAEHYTPEKPAAKPAEPAPAEPETKPTYTPRVKK